MRSEFMFDIEKIRSFIFIAQTLFSLSMTFDHLYLSQWRKWHQQKRTYITYRITTRRDKSRKTSRTGNTKNIRS